MMGEQGTNSCRVKRDSQAVGVEGDSGLDWLEFLSGDSAQSYWSLTFPVRTQGVLTQPQNSPSP